MIWASGVLLAVSFPLWWILTGYFQQPATQNLSFTPADGWCEPATQGIGIHCFGDFQLPRILIDAPSVWADPNNIAVGYTPAGLIPHAAAKGLENAGLGVRGSLIAFLVAMAIAMAIPALLTALRGAKSARGPLPLLFFFAAAAPVLIAFDRGNSVGFAVPFLLAFAIFAGRNPRWVAPAAIIAAAAVRPQFVLLAVALIAFKRARDAVAAAVGAALVIGLSFVAWPGDRIENIRAWWADLGAYSGSRGPDEPVINLSAARAVYVLGENLSSGPAFVGSAGRGIQEFAVQNPGLPGIGLLLACIAAFFVRRGSIPRPIPIVIGLALPALVPGLSFGYYLIFAVVVAVIICGPATPGHARQGAPVGALAALSKGRVMHGAWAWLLVITTGLSLAPLVTRSLGVSYTPVLNQAGLLWMLVCLFPLAWGAASWVIKQANAPPGPATKPRSHRSTG